MLDEQRDGLGVAVDSANVEQRRSVDSTIVVGVVHVPAALGRRERVQHVDDRLPPSQPQTSSLYLPRLKLHWFDLLCG